MGSLRRGPASGSSRIDGTRKLRVRGGSIAGGGVATGGSVGVALGGANDGAGMAFSDLAPSPLSAAGPSAASGPGAGAATGSPRASRRVGRSERPNERRSPP